MVKKEKIIGKEAQTIKQNDGTVGVNIAPKRIGEIKITVSVQQNGEEYSKDYNLTVYKYTNPIKTFKIDKKEYAGKFNKWSAITDKGTAVTYPYERNLTKKECKHTLGGKSYNLKMKKGYKLVKITYRNKGEWVKKHTLKKSSPKLPKDFWELYIVYKDKNGNKWTNSIFYSSHIFE